MPDSCHRCGTFLPHDVASSCHTCAGFLPPLWRISASAVAGSCHKLCTFLPQAVAHFRHQPWRVFGTTVPGFCHQQWRVSATCSGAPATTVPGFCHQPQPIPAAKSGHSSALFGLLPWCDWLTSVLKVALSQSLPSFCRFCLLEPQPSVVDALLEKGVRQVTTQNAICLLLRCMKPR